MFQSLTGSPSHLDTVTFPQAVSGDNVSIPNGLPKPFKLALTASAGSLILPFQSLTGSPSHLDDDQHADPEAILEVSIPNGLPKPFRPSQAEEPTATGVEVSIPNGLP